MTERKTMVTLFFVWVAILIGHACQYMGEIVNITKFEEIWRIFYLFTFKYVSVDISYVSFSHEWLEENP